MIEKFKTPDYEAIIKENQLYILPHKLLRSYIAHYTITFPRSHSVFGQLTLIPDASGCMIFTFDDNKVTSGFWGATTKTVTVNNDAIDIRMRLFIEFLPGGAYHLTGLCQRELTDLQLSLDDIQSAIASDIVTALEKSKDLLDFINELDAILLLYYSKVRVDQTTKFIVPYLNNLKGAMSVTEVSNMTSYSKRHLNRIFNNMVGMNVKKYLQLLRINSLLKELKEIQARQLPLKILAQNRGYYDQAHFIHDFKAVCGVNPTEYLLNMSDFYNEMYKF